MVRDLTDLEIRQLLQDQCYGHLCCCVDATHPYVVPVTYVYKDGAIYTFSFEGQKLDMMRRQPKVCFQVENFIDAASWQSAIVWGTFQELEGSGREDALTLLIERFWEEANRKHTLYIPFRDSARSLEQARDGKEAVIYRIAITEKTGRYEKYEV